MTSISWVMRMSNDLIQGLLKAGASVSAHDPQSMSNARQIFADAITYEDDYYDCLNGADALCICTEWSVYRRPAFPEVATRMNTLNVFDGRNLYDHARMT